MTIDFDIFWKVFPPIATFVGGIFLERYKTKTTLLEKTVNIQHIAYGANDENFGQIQILYNGSECQNLYSVYIRVENNTAKNISNFKLQMSVNAPFAIYRAYGQVFQRDVSLTLDLSEDFTKKMDVFSEHFNEDQKPNDWNHIVEHVLRQRSFYVPVLNKNSNIQVQLLVDGPLDFSEVNVGVFEEGIETIRKTDTEQYKKNRQNIVNGLAGLIFILTPFIILQYVSSLDTAVWTMVAANFLCYVIAWIFFFTGRWVSGFFR